MRAATSARFAPVLLLSPYAGLLVDRFPKRHVLLVTQAGLGLVSLTLGILVLTGNVGLGQVVVLALAFGTFSAVDNPARQAFVAEVVGRDLLRNAVTLNSTAVNVARVIGPAIAAVLAATVGLGWCFIGNAVSFLFVIASLLLLDGRQLHPVPPVHRAAGQLRAGLRYAAKVPDIARPLLMMAAIGTFTFEFEVSLPLLARDTFHGTATTYSWLIGALGAGAVIGGLYAARSQRTGLRRLTWAAAAYAVAVGLVAAAPTLPAAIAACAITGAASVVFLTTGNSTPAHLRSGLPRPRHRLVVPGPGRQHADRIADHRRPVPAHQPPLGPGPGRGRVLRGRRHRSPAPPAPVQGRPGRRGTRVRRQLGPGAAWTNIVGLHLPAARWRHRAVGVSGAWRAA